MAITPNTTFTSGQILTAQQQNNFPRGIIAVTTSTSNVLTGTILSGLSTTFTAVANRNYRISVAVVTSQPVAGNRLIVSFNGGSTRAIDFTTGAASFNNLFGSSVQTYSAGSNTIDVTWTQVTGVSTPLAGVGNPHQLIIEDIGTA
jgi:hypothetical protein